jgi:hypothetical protein
MAGEGESLKSYITGVMYLQIDLKRWYVRQSH